MSNDPVLRILNCDIDGRGRHVKNKWGVASVLPGGETVRAKRATMVIERRYLAGFFVRKEFCNQTSNSKIRFLDFCVCCIITTWGWAATLENHGL